MSVPSILGRGGLEQVLEIPLDASEQRALQFSAEQLQQVIRTLDL